MLKNKKIDFTPFDMDKSPINQNPLLMPLIWGASYFLTRKFGLKVNRKDIKGLKPPYIVMSTHQGFSDYYIAPLALFPRRANYVSDMEGYAAFGESLYRGIGCIGKRRYVPEYSVVKNIRYALNKKRVVVLFPESRHCNAGINSLIPDNMGRLCKLMNVPVVTLSIHGSYLANPFWDEEHTRKTKMTAKLECICNPKEIKDISEAELQKRIEEKLTYDEYQWQLEQEIHIKEEKRAQGIHKPLYQCKACGEEFSMKSEGITLFCDKCKSSWILEETGQLRKSDQTMISVPDWYRWQEKNVIEEIQKGQYKFNFPVKIEALPNSKGFISMGNGRVIHTAIGFVLIIGDKVLKFPTSVMESVQTEYNYRGRGMCLVLSTKDCCYYLYSEDKEFNVTKVQFATEYFYRKKSQ